MPQDPLPEASTADLIKGALEQSKELIQTEIALARHEALSQLLSLKRAAIATAIFAGAAIVGVTLLLMAVVVAVAPQPQTALGIGGFFLSVAAVAGVVGYKAVPHKPLAETQKELKADARMIEAQL